MLWNKFNYFQVEVFWLSCCVVLW